MNVLLTGHTGFKGAWMTMLLSTRGDRITGLALPAEADSLYQRARVGELLAAEYLADMRDPAVVADAVRDSEPEVIIHMAAQATVPESYLDPTNTIETNVLGTLNLLEAVRSQPSVRALLVITSDKVYEPSPDGHAHREGDPLGGNDPYSASKAMADILTSAYATSFPRQRLSVCTGRAGNVIGGGDHHVGRLIPDLLTSLDNDQTAVIRNPDAIRPWQHVLDVLNGYLLLVERMVRFDTVGPWNFGPDVTNCVSVRDLISIVGAAAGREIDWTAEATDFAENPSLLLDSSKSHAGLGWSNGIGLSDAVGWTVAWNAKVSSGVDARVVSAQQISDFLTNEARGTR